MSQESAEQQWILLSINIIHIRDLFIHPSEVEVGQWRTNHHSATTRIRKSFFCFSFLNVQHSFFVRFPFLLPDFLSSLHFCLQRTTTNQPSRSVIPYRYGIKLSGSLSRSTFLNNFAQKTTNEDDPMRWRRWKKNASDSYRKPISIKLDPLPHRAALLFRGSSPTSRCCCGGCCSPGSVVKEDESRVKPPRCGFFLLFRGAAAVRH